MEEVKNITMRELQLELKQDNIKVLTDSNVFKLYPQLFTGWTYVFPAGEKSKTMDGMQKVLLQMLEDNVSRFATLYTVGGGVTGDMGGFCAAVYKRGIKWINIPTTLLAQCDSSIGGKTAVDIGGFKNMVGSFYPPKKVLVCEEFLKTLQEREILCGMGEIVKTALLNKDVYLLYEEFLQNKATLGELSEACRRAKMQVVQADPFEKGLRKILNLGHTVGHALETAGDFELSHGEYVLQGLAIESFLTKSPLHDNITQTAQKYVKLSKDFNAERITEIALSDKKNEGRICVMHVEDIGKIEERNFTAQEFTAGLNEWEKL